MISPSTEVQDLVLVGETMDDLSSTGMTAEQLAAVRALDALTDEQRQEVFYFYCQGCGRKQFREPADARGCTCKEDGHLVGQVLPAVLGGERHYCFPFVVLNLTPCPPSPEID